MTDVFVTGRQTLYKGVRMRSRLEADFAAFLDRSGADWEYEPECFAGPAGQWLPDFRVTNNGTTVYFEVKPESFADDQIDAKLTQMSVVWLSEPTAVLQLTIWPYGDPAQSYSFMGIPPEGDDDDGLTWWCTQGGGEMTPWPGMGQLERFIERARQESEQSAGGAS